MEATRLSAEIEKRNKGKTQAAAASLTPNAGTVPQSLGSLTAMQQIGLHLNRLSGTLPSSLGNMLNATLLCAWGLAVHVNACC